MDDRLTPEHVSALKGRGIPPKQVAPLLNAGLDPDTAVTVALARNDVSDSNKIALWILDDAVFYERTRDAALLQHAIGARRYTHELNQVLTHASHLTTADLDTVITLNLGAVVATAWADAGRSFSELADVSARVPDSDNEMLAFALLSGVTQDDLAWLHANGRTLPLYTARYDIDTRITDAPEPRRRLMLALLALGHQLESTSAIVTALGDAEWLDTLTRLALDGTPVDTAITLARADHGLEQQRAVTLTRNPVPRAAVAPTTPDV